jgi:hypothetical protein
MAMAVMVFALAGSWLLGASARIMLIQAVVLAGSAAFILSRPSGPAT